MLDDAGELRIDAGQMGYLVPQFPGQTHNFFWREVQALDELGGAPVLLSTRKPTSRLISHRWSDEAMARTTYLASASPTDVISGALHAPWDELRRAASAEPDPAARRTVLRDAALSLPAARRLLRLCRAKNIGHVHVHSCARAAMIAALARRMGGPSYSLTLHGPMSDYGPGQGFKWRHAAFATVITEVLLSEVREHLGSDIPDRLLIQPMGVDVEHYIRSTPYSPPARGEPLKLFACGRLNVVKGHQDLLEAIRILLDSGLDVRLEIAGEDDDGGEGYHHVLQSRLEELGLQAHATLLGAIDGEEVKARLVASDVFVLASWHEPLGVAYMEAMACEVPTIGTAAGGVRELIRDGKDGLLVPPKSPQELAEAVRRLAHDSDLCTRLSKQGRRRIEERFSSARGARTLLEQVSNARLASGIG